MQSINHSRGCKLFQVSRFELNPAIFLVHLNTKILKDLLSYNKLHNILGKLETVLMVYCRERNRLLTHKCRLYYDFSNTRNNDVPFILLSCQFSPNLEPKIAQFSSECLLLTEKTRLKC